jgi:hypothetical protein
MTKEIGLWIDHRQAVIVTDFSQGDGVRQVASNMEKHVRYAVSRPSSGGAKPHQVSSENGRDRRFNDYLGRYYDDVISKLGDAASILIMGPGEAKTELQKRLESKSIRPVIVTVKSADKMTEPEIVAAVREHFQPQSDPIPHISSV